ncbi:MAG: DUF2007 domain-containing protein [Candidatus Vogelbacteria bacterium]
MHKIKFFNSIVEAELAKNLLKENGVESSVQKRGIEFSGDMGDSFGADLFVSEKDVLKANELLEMR